LRELGSAKLFLQELKRARQIKELGAAKLF